MKVFVILLYPCFVFLQKLVFPGFLLLFEGYHENLHKISGQLVPLTPLGWSRARVMKIFVFLVLPCFLFLEKLILPGFLKLFEGCHENLHKISNPLISLKSSGYGLEPELRRFLCFCCLRVLFFLKNSYFQAFSGFLKVTMRIYIKFPIDWYP